MEFYARQIGLMTQRRVRVAEAGMAVEPHHIYLAPGDAHLMVVANGRRREIALDRRPVENGCCPSADPMLDSVAEVYGKGRSEEHTSELQSLMRISYAVF